MDPITPPFEIFAAALPGLEPLLAQEAAEKGFAGLTEVPGGVNMSGGWADVWRANLELRGAGRVLVRIGGFRAFHLAQLDKRARKFPWGDILRPDIPVRVEAICRKSKIYHAGAASERIARAITEELGAPLATGDEPAIRLMARIEDDLVTFSLDTSGEPLHRRGHKVAVNKAPLRETMAAMFLRHCGYRGDLPVVDPMCGSGTFVIEAAEIAAGLAPGRSRAFAFQNLASYDPLAYAALIASPRVPLSTGVLHRGYDRDAGAIRMSTENAARAGVEDACAFACQPISDLTRPEGPAGLIMVNPPYGGRIGNPKLLFGLYGTLGKVVQDRFSGWRVGLVTSEAGLARATELPWLPDSLEVPHGGMRVKLYRTDPL